MVVVVRTSGDGNLLLFFVEHQAGCVCGGGNDDLLLFSVEHQAGCPSTSLRQQRNCVDHHKHQQMCPGFIV